GLVCLSVLILFVGCRRQEPTIKFPTDKSPGGTALAPAAFNKKITDNQQRIIQISQRFAPLVAPAAEGNAKAIKDIEQEADAIRKGLKEATAEIDTLTTPSPEGKPFLDAYRQLLQNQTKFWDNEGRKMVAILVDTKRSRDDKSR